MAAADLPSWLSGMFSSCLSDIFYGLADETLKELKEENDLEKLTFAVVDDTWLFGDNEADRDAGEISSASSVIQDDIGWEAKLQMSENKELNDEELLAFVKSKRNRSTTQKTDQVVKRFQQYILEAYHEERLMESIEPTRLNNYFANFFLSIKKRDGSDYEPDTLNAYQNSLERHLRDRNYEASLLRSDAFNSSRQVLASKRRELKESGLGNRPNSAQPLEAEDEERFWSLGLLGDSTPRSLQETLMFLFTKGFGWRGCHEAKQCKFGDITLKNENNKRFLEWNERCTKTRTGVKGSNPRSFKPKIFEIGGERCPVRLFELFVSKRPITTREPEYVFFLTPKQKSSIADPVCYIACVMGVNYLGKIVANMASHAGLEGKYTNHSLRKTTCQTLQAQNIAPNVICQLTGHRNVNSLNRYAVATRNQQEEMSNLLVGGKRSIQNNPEQLSIEPGPSVNKRPALLPPPRSVFPAVTTDASVVPPRGSTSNIDTMSVPDTTNHIFQSGSTTTQGMFQGATIHGNIHIQMHYNVSSSSANVTLSPTVNANM